MGTVFLGSEELARGAITRSRLRTAYRALFPDVYQPAIAAPTLYANTVGAWLWSKRRGVITGRAAAALHGAEWVDEDSPVELIWRNNRPPQGIIARDDRFAYDEVVEIDGLPVASIQRTAFDLGRFLPRGQAVAHLDALARATGLQAHHVAPVAGRYKGARGARRCREALDAMDAGAQSPKETWLRLLLIDAGFPRPITQIPVGDDHGEPFAHLDMGWKDQMIAVEYDGEQHQDDRRRYVWDHRRLTLVRRRGWLHVRVINEDRPYDIVQRVREAWALRENAHRATERPA